MTHHAPQTIAVKLKPAAERHVKKGHPWVYDKGIVKESKTPVTGDKAIIFDQKKNKFLAIGLYDMDSPIRIKVLQAHKSASLDYDWFKSTITQALDLRKPLIDKDVTGYRLIHGENDSLPALIVDVYEDIAVMKIYSLMWMPYLDIIKESIVELLAPRSIILRNSRNIASALKKTYDIEDGKVIHGELTSPEVIIQEYGVQYKVNVPDGHKTGYFLDHRENRRLVGSMSKDLDVLDVFSYAGGFSIHALVGGAKSVTSIDISKQALLLAQENAFLNGAGERHHTLAGDAFDLMDRLIKEGQKYDIIIVDPPSFAKQADEVHGALNSYQKLAARASLLVKPQGLLVLASCSARVTSDDFFHTVESELNHQGINYIIERKTYHDIDHPITFPEGAYLKCGYYRLFS